MIGDVIHKRLNIRNKCCSILSRHAEKETSVDLNEHTTLHNNYAGYYAVGSENVLLITAHGNSVGITERHNLFMLYIAC